MNRAVVACVFLQTPHYRFVELNKCVVNRGWLLGCKLVDCRVSNAELVNCEVVNCFLEDETTLNDCRKQSGDLTTVITGSFRYKDLPPEIALKICSLVIPSRPAADLRKKYRCQINTEGEIPALIKAL